MHDRTNNAYSFKKDGVAFKIQSLIEEGEVKSSSPNVLMVGEKEFLNTLEEGEVVGFLLVLKPKQEVADKEGKKIELPKEVQEMLDEYKDIVSDGQLATLHPKRLVSHQIDIIPRATLPKKAAYKMMPQQNEEIAKQIQ